MGSTEVIACYESLAAFTDQMSRAARKGEGDALVGSEQQRTAMVSVMK